MRRLLEVSDWTAMSGPAVQSWDSIPQVLRPLRHRGHPELKSTDTEHLAEIADQDPLVPALLAYREAAKQLNTYGLDYLETNVHTVDGRLRPELPEHGCVDGANVVPAAERAADTAQRGVPRRHRTGRRALVKCDYAQIELRLAADIAGDSALIEAFGRGDDPHALTASRVLDVPLESVTREQRQQAKALNFGLQYGMGAKTLREHALSNYGVVFSVEQATDFRERFFDSYRGLRRWHRRYKTAFDEEVPIETRTPQGRRAESGALHRETFLADPGRRPRRHQGRAGAVLRTPPRSADREPGAGGARRTGGRNSAEDVPVVAAWLRRCMVDGMSPWLTRVPVVVDVQIGRDWAGTPL